VAKGQAFLRSALWVPARSRNQETSGTVRRLRSERLLDLEDELPVQIPSSMAL